ncbi:MAG TPA: gephyrin-like molybdotransferase Glp [Rhodanobacteraceae bacterium]|nr:gephyrin-like molybdotransferase Glp [Rhodanobacteraceae bacterium]
MSDPEIPGRLPVAEARSRIVEWCRRRAMPAERVALDRALGRVAAVDMSAPDDVPSFVNSAMDGYAIRFADLTSSAETRLRVSGVLLAGAGKAPTIAAGECLRITTGAPLPAGADTVVIKERVRLEGDHVLVPAGECVGANVRRAGEDYRKGDIAIGSGRRLNPVHLGVLASFGCTEVLVSRTPRVALFSSGDELVAPDQAPGFGQIHDSNRYSLAALLRQGGIEPARLGHLADDIASMRDALLDAAADCDVIVTCGGVSAGEADFMPRLVRETGRIHFWKVRIKPGMPMLFGEISGTPVFALPGNPVSAIVTFLVLVRPGLAALQGVMDAPRTWHARLVTALGKTHSRTEYLRARLESREDGGLWAAPFDKQGSGMQRGAAEADCLIVVPERTRTLAAGAVVEILPLPGLC